MKNICSLVALFISASSMAAGIDSCDTLYQQGAGGTANSNTLFRERSLLSKKYTPEFTCMSTFTHVDLDGPFVIETKLGNAFIWNRTTLSYRVSDDIRIGVIGNNFLGRGIGLEYGSKNVSAWASEIRNRATGKIAPAIGIRILF